MKIALKYLLLVNSKKKYNLIKLECLLTLFYIVRELMETFNQEPYAGQKLKEWVVDVGLEHIITEETNVDCGNLHQIAASDRRTYL